MVADQDLFDVHLWIKSVAESADIEDRATLRQMGEWVEEEKDSVNKSLDHAKRLNHKMSEISQSLVSSARSDHKSLRQKLKDQYFSFQAQLTNLVTSLEEEETKRRSMAMTNIMLKQKLMMVKMNKARPQNPNRSAAEGGNGAEGVGDGDGGAGEERIKATLAQRNLDLAQLRARFEEVKEALDTLKAVKAKQDTQILHLKDQATALEQAKEKADSTAREQAKDLDNEGRFSRLLQAVRDSMDRKTYPGIDPDDVAIPNELLQLPREVAGLYKVLDEYSNKLKRLEEHMQSTTQNTAGKVNSFAGYASEHEMKEALEASPDVQALRQQLQELKATNCRQKEKMKKQTEEIVQQTALIEKVKKMRRSSAADSDPEDDNSEQGEAVVLDPVTGMPILDPVTGLPLKRRVTKEVMKENAQGRYYGSAEKICSRLVEFHNNVVENIIGVGSSKLTNRKLEDMLATAKDTVGGVGLVSSICEALEEYLRKYWADSGVKDMAEQIRNVTEHNARKTSAHFEHLSQLKKLQGMMKEANESGRKDSDSKSWLNRIMERYEEQQQRWEAKRRQIVQERADAILKCMSSVLHVVTLNIGINIEAGDKQNIISSLQASCIGRGNAFWPRQKQATTEIATFDSAPSSRAQTAGEKKSSNTTSIFSVTRLPLHRQMPDEFSMRSSRVGDTSYKLGMDSLRQDADSFRHRSPLGDGLRGNHSFKLDLDSIKAERMASARPRLSPRAGRHRSWVRGQSPGDGRPAASPGTSDGRSPAPGSSFEHGYFVQLKGRRATEDLATSFTFSLHAIVIYARGSPR